MSYHSQQCRCVQEVLPPALDSTSNPPAILMGRQGIRLLTKWESSSVLFHAEYESWKESLGGNAAVGPLSTISPICLRSCLDLFSVAYPINKVKHSRTSSPSSYEKDFVNCFRGEFFGQSLDKDSDICGLRETNDPPNKREEGLKLDKNDVGPKIFISYGMNEELGRGDSVNNLHFSMRDMVMTNQEAVECIRNIKDAKAAAKHLTC
ncbi:hypothetical protein LOK49_LG11G01529 [Camellia lanceoleosa]|uniref:Uncharacterized protein n=1 Tax=Camellia lanceoleosa TaxID=1840588 RepID=A0ACC0G0W9_9ERIC|nr:hypothetical protein LOK49_LG11G01529 [Camellia lanceoleosa]